MCDGESQIENFFFSSRRRHTRCALGLEFRRVLFRSHATLPARHRPIALGRLRLISAVLATKRLVIQLAAIRAFVVGRFVVTLRPASGVDQGQQARSFLPIFKVRSEEHTSELQSLMRISYAVFCLKKKKSKPPATQTYID